jgi:hypothetical protein
MQSFKIVAYLLLGYFWLVEEEDEWLIIEASLASDKVSAGAVAKADQNGTKSAEKNLKSNTASSNVFRCLHCVFLFLTSCVWCDKTHIYIL